MGAGCQTPEGRNVGPNGEEEGEVQEHTGIPRTYGGGGGGGSKTEGRSKSYGKIQEHTGIPRTYGAGGGGGVF